jgi:hypothetical protein
MKHTCPKCHEVIDVSEGRILSHIERSASFRRKVESLLNSIRGKRAAQNMTPEERHERALIASKAAARKRKKENETKEEKA